MHSRDGGLEKAFPRRDILRDQLSNLTLRSTGPAPPARAARGYAMIS
jgi:hypothetical protein